MKAITLFLTVLSLLVIGCAGADPGPNVKSLKQYRAGEFDPGWLFKGLTPTQAKVMADGLIDTESKELALKIFAQMYSNISKEEQETFIIGKFILNNESNKSVQVGVDGPMSTNWLIKAKERIDDILIPGIYTVWIDKGNGGGRVYQVYKEDTPDGLHKKGDPILLEITLTPKNFGKEKTSGYVNIPKNF